MVTTFDNRIRELRTDRSMSLQTLADICNTTVSTVQKLETGEQRLNVEWMRKIARAFNCAPSDLLLDEDKRPYLTEHERRVLEAYRTAPSENRPVIIHLVECLGEKLSEDLRAAANS